MMRSGCPAKPLPFWNGDTKPIRCDAVPTVPLCFGVAVPRIFAPFVCTARTRTRATGVWKNKNPGGKQDEGGRSPTVVTSIPFNFKNNQELKPPWLLPFTGGCTARNPTLPVLFSPAWRWVRACFGGFFFVFLSFPGMDIHLEPSYGSSVSVFFFFIFLCFFFGLEFCVCMS